jgi:hypothetical protein
MRPDCAACPVTYDGSDDGDMTVPPHQQDGMRDGVVMWLCGGLKE